VPILQSRGVYRRSYAGDTVRERYRLPFPLAEPPTEERERLRQAAAGGAR